MIPFQASNNKFLIYFVLFCLLPQLFMHSSLLFYYVFVWQFHQNTRECFPVQMSGDLGVSAFPEGESIFSWVGTIEGAKGTVYEGLSYKLSLRFPLEYPFKPPQVKFETLCFHPNVDQFGNICLDILQDKWSSAYDCRTILLSIQSLLGEPNLESPFNSCAAALWNNKEDYRKMVHKQSFAGELFEE